MQGFKDIKYDIPVCHEGYEGHEGHEVYDGHIYIYIYKLTERIVVLLNTIFEKESKMIKHLTRNGILNNVFYFR